VTGIIKSFILSLKMPVYFCLLFQGMGGSEDGLRNLMRVYLPFCIIFSFGHKELTKPFPSVFRMNKN
jgi:hypothetical protein